MGKTILVALKRNKITAALLRRLERVVEPGHRMVFLIEYQHDTPSWLLAHVGSLQTGFDRGLAWQEQSEWLSWDEQKTRAEKNVAEPARRAFGAIGAVVYVDLYWGSLNRAIQRYLDGSEIGRILVEASWLRRLMIAPIRVRNWRLRHRTSYTSTLLTFR